MDNFQLQKWTRNYSLSNKLNGLLQQEEPEQLTLKYVFGFIFMRVSQSIYKLQVDKLLLLETNSCVSFEENWWVLRFWDLGKLEFWTRPSVSDNSGTLSPTFYLAGMSRFRVFEKVPVMDFQTVTVYQLLIHHMCITTHESWRSIGNILKSTWNWWFSHKMNHWKITSEI